MTFIGVQSLELRKLKALFALLYFVQGGVFSYITVFQKPYLNSLGIDRSIIGPFSALLLLPFILKIFFGLLSDKIKIKGFGNRKPYMVLGLVMASLAFLATYFVSPDKNFFLYASFVLLASFSVALFDAATDGFAIDQVEEQFQGTIQSYMISGRALGVILFSLFIGYWADAFGYQVIFLMFSLVSILPVLVVFKANENATDQKRHQKVPNEMGLFKSATYLIAGAIAVTGAMISFGSDGLLSLYLSDSFKITQQQIGVFGSYKGIGSVVGALTGGFLLQRLPMTRVYYLGLALLALGLLGNSFLVSVDNFLIMAVIWGVFWGFHEVCFLTLAMHTVKSFKSAFGFAFLMALANIGAAIGEGVATPLTRTMSYSSVFLTFASLVLLPLMLLIWYKSKERAS